MCWCSLAIAGVAAEDEGAFERDGDAPGTTFEEGA
jgi:hypothetical protein